MSRTDILEDIKKAEAAAKVTVEQAEADKKTAIADARRASVQKIQDAEAKARSNYDASIEKEMKALASKRNALLTTERDKQLTSVEILMERCRK